MAVRTTYTSTITVPVYGSWKCEHCGEVNFATGVIVCKRQETTGSRRPSDQREAEGKAAFRVKAEWTSEAFQIISDPNNHAQDMRNGLFLQNTNCTKCGKKPKWDKDMKYLTWSVLCFMPAIISGIIAFATLTGVAAWLIFIALSAVTATALISEPRYKKMMKNLPKEYAPVLGSLDAELIAYAEHLGKSIPNPDKTIEIVKGYDKSVNSTAEKPPVINESASSANNSNVVQCNFCRKCGAKLQADSDFCHKCGTQIIKQ